MKTPVKIIKRTVEDRAEILCFMDYLKVTKDSTETAQKVQESEDIFNGCWDGDQQQEECNLTEYRNSPPRVSTGHPPTG